MSLLYYWTPKVFDAEISLTSLGSIKFKRAENVHSIFSCNNNKNNDNSR